MTIPENPSSKYQNPKPLPADQEFMIEEGHHWIEIADGSAKIVFKVYDKEAPTRRLFAPTNYTHVSLDVEEIVKQVAKAGKAEELRHESQIKKELMDHSASKSYLDIEEFVPKGSEADSAVIYTRKALGNLEGYIRNPSEKLLHKEPFIREKFGSDMLMAIAEMHKAGYLHGDLKPENYLLRPNSSCVLSDFGKAVRIRDGEVPPLL